ncbi:hypothetical protein M501DRAFT_933372 [Patellaria atrata CBS 101060]|uniref:Arb2 domain-containing protein n=1 Tax=Patellaria atrata CBS 101060 TaxID=1346257 RepID=A0A9P4SAF0_9PEZI|nr:hypothetical protein M501DRAFT_933372 [Patellaria atrata CBS 101060]
MYRRHLSGLPRNLVFPDTFEGLGYFVNAKSQIRQIKNPKEGYVFRICTDERTNELNREAFHICVRAEVNKRLKEAGLQELYLPQETTDKPRNKPHLPIMITPNDELKSKKRVIVIINHSYQDLGITSHRYLQREGGLEGGTLVRFIKNVNSRLADQEGPPGFVILNPGMLVFSYKANAAMTHLSWHCKRLPSRYHPSDMQHDNLNNIPGHTSPSEHIRSVFQRVINNPDYVNKDAQLYVVGLNDGADNFLGVASKYCE